MARQILDPTPLHEAVARLPQLATGEMDVILYIESPLALATPDCAVIAFKLDDDADAEPHEDGSLPAGFDHLIEADTAAEAAEGLVTARRAAGAPAPGPREQAAAVLFYAIFDAWLPVGEKTRPMGGRASWGGSADAAAEANLMTASELRARFPDRDVPAPEEQAAAGVGDEVVVMVWFASDDGPFPDTRPVRIVDVDGGVLAAVAVGAEDVRLQLRPDHIVGLPRD